MSFMNDFYPESEFGGFTNIDGTISFYMRVNALLKPSSVVLDIGCGRGAYGEDRILIRRNLRILKGKVKKVIGVDADKVAATNPFIDEFHLIDNDSLPLEDASVDCCVCDYVLEHIEKPDSFFAEIHRVLKSGGYLCVRTPNIYGYPYILSKLVPNKYHNRITSKVQGGGRKEQDVFPTYYRCNKLSKMKSILNKYGFQHAVYRYEAEPAYLSFSRYAYRLGVWYQRFSPEFLKTILFAFARKI